MRGNRASFTLLQPMADVSALFGVLPLGLPGAVSLTVVASGLALAALVEAGIAIGALLPLHYRRFALR